jgi:hypothetical protein
VNVANERGRRLALVYHPFSFATMALVSAAQGVCDLTWVIDTSLPQADLMSKLLTRFGSVVDVAGLSVDDAAARIADRRPDGLLAQVDAQMPWAAQVAQRLDLPFIAPAVAERATDKYVQRTALKAAGVPVPAFWPIPQADDAAGWDALTIQASFPAILKPRRGAASRGVVLVRSLAQLRQRIGELAPEAAAAGELLLEGYLPDCAPDEPAFANYVSVESIVSAERVSHVAITGRFPPAEPFRETGFFMPSALSDDDREAVLEVATASISAIGVSVGCMHTEIKLTPDGPRVIELNPRVGGAIAKIAPIATGIDLLAIAMRLALGETLVFDELAACTQVTYMLYVHAPASMRWIVAVDGLDRLARDPAVRRTTLNRGPGDSVHWRDGNWGHVFTVLGVVADHEQLKQIEQRVHAETRIRGT